MRVSVSTRVVKTAAKSLAFMGMAPLGIGLGTLSPCRSCVSDHNSWCGLSGVSRGDGTPRTCGDTYRNPCRLRRADGESNGPLRRYLIAGDDDSPTARCHGGEGNAANEPVSGGVGLNPP
jgi:hypothetical protein